MFIKRTTSQNEDFLKLVSLLDQTLRIADGDEHQFYAQFNKIDTIKNVVVIYENEVAIGCGAFKEYDSKTVEIKRMFVIPESRSRGVAGKILKELEDWAIELNYSEFVLETGKSFESAISLYKKSSAFLPKSSGTGHSESFLRTRFNSIAMAKLGTDGKVMAGISFPEGSLIVKELYNDTTKVSKYAILYKQSSNPNADSKGWVWGYLNGDGTVIASADKKGSGCISCHSQTGSIDYTLMNKYF